MHFAKNMFWKLVLIVLISIPFLSKSETGNKIQFVPIDQELSQNTVTCILQDTNGFLWVGTRSGLNKYDGVNMVIYDHDLMDPTSLPNSYIRAVYQDRDSVLWIGTYEGGLSRYNEKTDSFESFVYEPENYASINSNYVTAIFEDHLGELWVGTTYGGLNKFDRSTEKFTHFKYNQDDPFSVSANHITGIIEDNDGNLWVSTWGGGLNLFDRNSARFIRYVSDPNDPNTLSSNVIRNVSKGKNGDLWISTQEGLDRMYYAKTGRYTIDRIQINSKKVGRNVKVALSALEDSKGRIWMGTENGGVVLLKRNGEIIDHFEYDPINEYGLKSNSIWSLFEDKDSIVWVGTFNRGLFKADPHYKKFKHVKQNPFSGNSLSHSSVSCFAEDKSGNVWIGTDGGGLNYWDRKSNKYTHFNTSMNTSAGLGSDAVLSLLVDSNDNLWVGTWEGGVYVRRHGSNSFEPFNVEGFDTKNKRPPTVFSMIEDEEGSIWIAAFREGLYIYNPSTEKARKFVHLESNLNCLTNNLVKHLKMDSRSDVWVATEGGGIIRCTKQNGGIQFTPYLVQKDKPSSLSGSMVTFVQEDSRGRIWVGTSQGLNLYNQELDNFTRYDTRHGLPNDVIYGIEEDDNEQLWISTNKGLARVDLDFNEVRNYETSDGIQSREFYAQSCAKLKSGELLFGGINGFNIFYPEEISNNTSNPQAYIKDFKISNQSIKPGPGSVLGRNIANTKSIELTHDQNDFSFEFAVLSFSQSEKNIYTYQLENYERGWQYAGNRRNAFYTNVPPGRYVFSVKGTNNDGMWSDKVASVNIQILPAWYNTYWAYSIYIIIVTAILVWGIQTIVNRERLQTKLKMEHIELSKMQELDEMKSRFFANISHEFRSPLTLILGPLKEMFEGHFRGNPKEQYALMIRNAESLLNQINQLLDLSKLESGNMRLEAARQDVVVFLKPVLHSFNSLADRKFIRYKIDLPKQEIQAYFEKDKMEKIVVNLLSNAFKYTPDFGKIIFKVEQTEHELVMSIADNGVGIPEDEVDYIFNRYYRVNDKKIRKNKGTGIGLSLTKELVELHKGQIELVSEEDSGTTFRVILPLGKEHLDSSEVLDQSVDYQFERQGLYELDEKIELNDSSNETTFTKEEDNRPLIVLVEDNPDIRDYIKLILEEEYKILEASNGARGVDLAQHNIPDLIITDIMMPEMDGYELCKIIKSDFKTSHIPVIALTAKASNESALEGFEKGVDYYITKPFNPKMLILRIRNIINTTDQIKKNLLNKELEIAPTDVKIASRDENFLKEAIKIVEDNMSNSDFYVDDLGRELGLSRMQLYRKLKGLIGQSANEFVRSIRLKRAAQLIRQKHLTISEITYEVGFNDLQYFRDCFKKQFGVNPSEYLGQLSPNS